MDAGETAGHAPHTGISVDELQLATRNNGMPLEALAWSLTPAGLHYLLGGRSRYHRRAVRRAGHPRLVDLRAQPREEIGHDGDEACSGSPE